MRAYKVVLNKISQEIVSHWSKPAHAPWQDIDPYSSLEEVDSSQVSEADEDVISENPVTSVVSVHKYSLRQHSKSASISSRPQTFQYSILSGQTPLLA